MSDDAARFSQRTEHPAEDLTDLYENAPCGYLSMLADGRIFRANATLAHWTGYGVDELASKRLTDLLTIGTRIFYETHGAPMLGLQGRVDELALELKTANGTRVPVLASGVAHVDAAGAGYVRFVLFRVTERRRWERELVDARAESETRLRSEMDTAALREQFIAVLGHDLRNPVASILGGMALLRRRAPLGSEALRVVDLVEGSVARMSALIDDVLDFARGRLGGGTTLDLQRRVPLGDLLAQVVGELGLSSGRTIETDIALAEPVDCDPSRIGQLVSNLLGNALTHGGGTPPVRLGAHSDRGDMVLTVANGGTPIPPAAMARLFQPFVRGKSQPDQAGLGLGLYIASEIARAHGGALTVASSDAETRFTFRMPLRRAEG